jgi:hypothetical protein
MFVSILGKRLESLTVVVVATSNALSRVAGQPKGSGLCSPMQVGMRIVVSSSAHGFYDSSLVS